MVPGEGGGAGHPPVLRGPTVLPSRAVRRQAQWLFLRWGRPVAPAATLIAYATVEALRPETAADRMLLPLAVSVAVGVGYALLLPRLGAVAVLRALVVLDTLLIAWMTVALGRPDVLAIAYVWSLAIAGVLLGSRETLAATALAAACAVAVPYLSATDVSLVVVVTNAIVLVLVGAILAFAAQQARDAEARLLEEAGLNAAALRIGNAVRLSLDREEIFERAVSELGEATQAARALARLTVEHAPLHQWVRPGIEPVRVETVPATVAAVARERRPLVYESRDGVDDPAVLEYMRRFSFHAWAAYPIVWGGEVLAVIGLHDDRPRRWGPELALLERVLPQLAAALAQARAYGRERDLARMREELVANVSHELRTPLTSTLGFLQTLERRGSALAPAERERFLALATQQAQRLAYLVEDLLQLATVGRAMPLDRRQVALREVVEAAAQPLDLGGRALRIDVPAELRAEVDPRRLLQVFSNLLANAQRHGSGAIEVSGRREGDRLRVAVRDEGEELPEDARERIFLPFARWSADREGTGLGLPISRAIVEAHGGSLVYADGAFVLRLPGGA